MKKIILIGAGGHCKSVIDIIEQEKKFKIAGIVDNNLKLKNTTVFGYKVIGNDKDLSVLSKKIKYAFITIGHINSSLLRIKLYSLAIYYGFKIPKIISPYAYVSKHSNIGSGSVIMHNSIVNANAQIGNNCIINSNALIEHDCIISDHCHISTSAVINGGVKIGQGTFVGSNVTTKNSIKIKKNSFIKAGSLVK